MIAKLGALDEGIGAGADGTGVASMGGSKGAKERAEELLALVVTALKTLLTVTSDSVGLEEMNTGPVTPLDELLAIEDVDKGLLPGTTVSAVSPIFENDIDPDTDTLALNGPPSPARPQ